MGGGEKKKDAHLHLFHCVRLAVRSFMCSLQSRLVSERRMIGPIDAQPPGVIYPALTQSVNRNIYISPMIPAHPSALLNGGSSSPRLQRSFRSLLRQPAWTTKLPPPQPQPQPQSQPQPQPVTMREAVWFNGLVEVKGRRSGVQVWLPGCGCGPVWGSGTWSWIEASWLHRRWPGVCLGRKAAETAGSPWWGGQ